MIGFYIILNLNDVMRLRDLYDRNGSLGIMALVYIVLVIFIVQSFIALQPASYLTVTNVSIIAYSSIVFANGLAAVV